MLQRQLYLRLLSNLIIPVLGFWLWDWSLYFILLFYMLDLVSNEIVVRLKLRKVKFVQQTEQAATVSSTIYGIVAVLFFVLIVVQINLGIALLYPNFDFKESIWLFLTYKELGISQGFILLPLVAMMAYSSYKIDFLYPRLYFKVTEKWIWKNHLKQQFLVFSFSAILVFLSVGYRFSETTILVIIIVVSTLYNYFQGKELLELSQQD